MKYTLTILVFFVLACTSKYDSGDFKQLDWLLGTWEGKAGDATFYEHWMKVSDTELKNINFEIVDGDTANSHYAAIIQKDGNIIYKGSHELKATSLDSNHVTFENKEVKRKYIFTIDDQGRWIANLDNAGAKVEYQLSKTTPLEQLINREIKIETNDTLGREQ